MRQRDLVYGGAKTDFHFNPHFKVNNYTSRLIRDAEIGKTKDFRDVAWKTTANLHFMVKTLQVGQPEWEVTDNQKHFVTASNKNFYRKLIYLHRK